MSRVFTCFTIFRVIGVPMKFLGKTKVIWRIHGNQIAGYSLYVWKVDIALTLSERVGGGLNRVTISIYEWPLSPLLLSKIVWFIWQKWTYYLWTISLDLSPFVSRRCTFLQGLITFCKEYIAVIVLFS